MANTQTSPWPRRMGREGTQPGTPRGLAPCARTFLAVFNGLNTSTRGRHLQTDLGRTMEKMGQGDGPIDLKKTTKPLLPLYSFRKARVVGSSAHVPVASGANSYVLPIGKPHVPTPGYQQEGRRWGVGGTAGEEETSPMVMPSGGGCLKPRPRMVWEDASPPRPRPWSPLLSEVEGPFQEGHTRSLLL